MLIQSSVNLFGATIVAGNSAAANIEGFVYVSMNAFHQATVSFTSQNMGAGKHERINRILLCGEICALIVGVVMGNACVIFGNSLLGVYSSSPEVIQAGLVRLKVVAATYALCGMMDVMVGSLRGIGYSIMPMVVSTIGACGLRILWLGDDFPDTRISQGAGGVLFVPGYMDCYFDCSCHLFYMGQKANLKAGLSGQRIILGGITDENSGCDGHEQWYHGGNGQKIGCICRAYAGDH